MITNPSKPLTSAHLLIIQVQNYSTKSIHAHKRGIEVPRLLVKDDKLKLLKIYCIIYYVISLSIKLQST